MKSIFSFGGGQRAATSNPDSAELDELEARSREAQKALRHAANNAEQVIEALLNDRARARAKPTQSRSQ